MKCYILSLSVFSKLSNETFLNIRILGCPFANLNRCRFTKMPFFVQGGVDVLNKSELQPWFDSGQSERELNYSRDANEVCVERCQSAFGDIIDLRGESGRTHLLKFVNLNWKTLIITRQSVDAWNVLSASHTHTHTHPRGLLRNSAGPNKHCGLWVFYSCRTVNRDSDSI